MSGKEKKELSFEEALANLESIIDSMEKGETPLGELVENSKKELNSLRPAKSNLKTLNSELNP